MAEEGKSRARQSGGSNGRSTTRKATSRSAATRSRSNAATAKATEDFHPTAPSLGPNTVIEREPVEARLARHEQSEVDAMGKDKRRVVVGHSYGPSKMRQLALYGVFLLVVAALLFGGKLLVDSLDTPVGKNIPNSAPWAQPNAPQHPPKPLQ
jgi:hypothetical protein